MLFSDVIGQKEVKERLTRSVQEGRISHALLFFGPEGSGTLPLAMAYAQYILCPNRTTQDACGKCPACLKAAKLIHPDLHMVYPIALSKDTRISADVAAEWREAFLENPWLNLQDWFRHLSAENKQPIIAVDESAEILRRLALTTYEGEYKIMVIWMPEKMHPSAANKLLKILEEPPAKTLFLLVCENEEVLLRTIVSRTQQVKVNRLSDDSITRALSEGKGVPAEEARRLAILSEGNYNAALKFTGERKEAVYYLEQFREWMRLCYRADMAGIVGWVEEIANTKTGREKQKEFLAYGLHIVRECLALQYADPALGRTTGEEQEFIRKFSARLNGNTCLQMADELNKGILHIERNGSSKLIFTDISLKILQIIRQPVTA